MNILVAFDSFKDSMTAREACAAVARSIRDLHPKWNVDEAPLTDGGEGFCRVLTESLRGQLCECSVLGPRLEERRAIWGKVSIQDLSVSVLNKLNLQTTEGTLGIVEMAEASGLQLVPPAERTPWRTTTLGTGQLIAEAMRADVQGIVLGIGGSATNDLGLGALVALGIEVSGGRKSLFPENWSEALGLEGRLNPNLPPINVVCDVNNPLLGPHGATTVYGPQKGLESEAIALMEDRMQMMADKLCAYFKKSPSTAMEKGSGAAGGISFGLRVGCDAALVKGFDLVSAWLCLEERIAAADWVITGEGCFDSTSLRGKGPGTLLNFSGKAKKPTFILAGTVDKNVVSSLSESYPHVQAFSITPDGYPLKKALNEAQNLIYQKVQEVLNGQQQK